MRSAGFIPRRAKHSPRAYVRSRTELRGRSANSPLAHPYPETPMAHKAIFSLAACILIGYVQAQPAATAPAANDRLIGAHAERMIEEGRRIFRFDTFGSEAFRSEEHTPELQSLDYLV